MNTNTLPIMTVCYPWRRTVRADGSFLDEICIGTHKDSKGARKLRMVDKDNGPGGKMEPRDITAEHCAQRELFEEFGIWPTLEKIIPAGIIHVNNDGFESMLYFFFVDEWSGDIPSETKKDFRNIRFCNVNDLPYENMMDADKRYHLPLMLFSAMMRGEILRTNIIHDENMIVTSCTRFEYSKRG